MGNINPAGSLHARLSQKRMAEKHHALRDEAAAPKSRGEAFRKAFHRDMVGGIRGARKVGTPITVSTDAVLGTCRAKGPPLPARAKPNQNMAQIKQYPCSFGAVGTASGGINDIANAATVGAAAITGSTLGWAGGIVSPRKQTTMMRYGAVGGFYIAVPLLYTYAYANYGVREGAGMLSSAPKLMLNGVGAAGGSIVGLMRGTKAALTYKKR